MALDYIKYAIEIEKELLLQYPSCQYVNLIRNSYLYSATSGEILMKLRFFLKELIADMNYKDISKSLRPKIIYLIELINKLDV